MRTLLLNALVPALAAASAIPWAARVLRRAGHAPMRPAWAGRVAVWLCLAKALRGVLHALAWGWLLARGEAMSSGDAARAGAVLAVGLALGYAGPRLAARDGRAAPWCAGAAVVLLAVCAADVRVDPRMTAGTVASLVEAGLLLWAARAVRRDAPREV